MLTYYCPNCWKSVDASLHACPACGYELQGFDQLAFEDKLLAALNHSVPERRIMAAQILGNLKSRRALVEFEKIIRNTDSDYFTLRAVLLATAKIDHPKRNTILQLARAHESVLVSNLANNLIARIARGDEIQEWDQNTG